MDRHNIKTHVLERKSLTATHPHTIVRQGQVGLGALYIRPEEKNLQNGLRQMSDTARWHQHSTIAMARCH